MTYYDPLHFENIELARERNLAGGEAYEEWRARIHARDEDFPAEDERPDDDYWESYDEEEEP